jgi:hypothetical protein
MRPWFILFVIALVLWVGGNLLVHDEYDASLRPIYWVFEQMGFSVR